MASLDEQIQAGFLALKGEYQASLELCNQILKKKEIYDVYIIKAVCLEKLGQFGETIVASEDAILLDPSRYEGFFHKGVGNFYKAEFQSALITLGQAQDKTQSVLTKNKISDWQRKCKSEIDQRGFKDFLLESVPTPHQAFHNTTLPNPVNLTPQNFVVSSTGKISYTWYQTNLKVGIEIVHVLNEASKLRTNFEAKKIEVSFPIGEGRTFDLFLDLFDEIIPDKSFAKVLLNRIEIHLEKKNTNNFWKTLEAEDSIIEQGQGEDLTKKVTPVLPPVTQAAASYPTSSKKKKDWDKIDREIEVDMHKNRDEYASGDASMEMFKWIYQGSNEDTRRAMMKSFQESGGKALSTDWKDVKDKDYQGKDKLSPPKGMVEKEYEY